MRYSYNYIKQCRLTSQNVEQNKPATKEYIYIYMILYIKVQNRANLIYDVRSQDSGYPWERDW